jgi:hypothetical protein
MPSSERPKDACVILDARAIWDVFCLDRVLFLLQVQAHAYKTAFFIYVR